MRKAFFRLLVRSHWTRARSTHFDGAIYSPSVRGPASFRLSEGPRRSRSPLQMRQANATVLRGDTITTPGMLLMTLSGAAWRDGALASLCRTATGDAERGICEWLPSVAQVIHWREPLADQLLEVRYDDLLAQPTQTLATIAAFLDLAEDRSWLRSATTLISPPPRSSPLQNMRPPSTSCPRKPSMPRTTQARPARVLRQLCRAPFM